MGLVLHVSMNEHVMVRVIMILYVISVLKLEISHHTSLFLLLNNSGGNSQESYHQTVVLPSVSIQPTGAVVLLVMKYVITNMSPSVKRS